MRKLLGSVLFVAAYIVTPLAQTGWVTCIAADIPYLISRESEEVQETWRNVDELVRENAKLDSRIPDPLYARAELWASVGVHEEALDDYLEATKLFLQTKPNLIDQSVALKRLSDALEQVARRPSPDYPYEANDAFWIGYRLFNRQQFDVAVAYFSEASRLMPNDAVYRVYRALALLKVGNVADAERQLTVASSLMRRPNCPERDLRGYLIRLERVQGSDRQWVDSFVKSPLPTRKLAKVEAAELLRSQQDFLR